MDRYASSDIVLASSTSTIPASMFTEGLTHRSQCLVAHPVNPPLYLTLVEMVPAPWTDQNIMSKACEMMKNIGQVMSAGLGPRYAIHGPLQTIHLNANGIRDYLSRYGDGVRRVLADMGPTPTFKESKIVEKLETSLNQSMPLDQLTSLKSERERNLARIASLKKKME
ncbi:3-hydroxyacyl-CoA dehydrogenase, NAD binding domain protein [Necator americanus]|uniref:3-hydroxyacyl-CoA dehydrogenase, NAD binding domain protein n=1 Tax=Necator americanus TaxID=51031 RepID=W2TXA2_NECAM|nr:3-hydroxyacyl-CoA dehydrogenase, NAD binding domain protein [Necator americanus]ETN86259.1 3-hydroxyacyl-CoA dehydrogenase, NAD binding domain protein [Necator americanus]